MKALQFLEQLLEDHKAPLVDRYATGVALFATYARARFGDLKQIAEIFVDEAAPTENEGLGYLEMMSASHKMRSTGTRLGAHLPLIAPLNPLLGESHSSRWHERSAWTLRNGLASPLFYQLPIEWGPGLIVP